VNVPAVAVGTVRLTVDEPAALLTVCDAPPLMLYVKIYGAVPPAPVNVTWGAVVFLQTFRLPLMLAVGNGFTCTETDVLLNVLPQLFAVPSVTLNRLYVYVPGVDVGTATVAAVEAPVVLTVCTAPPLIL